MSYFNFQYKDLIDFIQKSKQCLEGNLEELKVEKHSLKEHDNPQVYCKIIDKLENLTMQEFIIWSREGSEFFRGVVVENCIFSNYKIIVEKFENSYRIALIKGLSDSRKVYCISDISTNTVEMQNLIYTIEMKLLQRLN